MNDSLDQEYYLSRLKNFHRRTNLLQEVYRNQVILEYIFTRGLIAYGTIRVNNCGFDKNVFVKFTIDQWKTFSTITANHTVFYSDSNTDAFQFTLELSKDKLPKEGSLSNVSFAICYIVNGQKFWDNNYTKDYHLDIVEK